MTAPIPPDSFRVTVETAYGQLKPQVVKASSLREALVRAYSLPFGTWFDDEIEEEDRVEAARRSG